jgi:hypothetical protein
MTTPYKPPNPLSTLSSVTLVTPPTPLDTTPHKEKQRERGGKKGKIGAGSVRDTYQLLGLPNMGYLLLGGLYKGGTL